MTLSSVCYGNFEFEVVKSPYFVTLLKHLLRRRRILVEFTYVLELQSFEFEDFVQSFI